MKKGVSLLTALLVSVSCLIAAPVSASSSTTSVPSNFVSESEALLCSQEGLQGIADEYGVELKKEIDPQNNANTILTIDDPEAASALHERMGIQAPEGMKPVSFVTTVPTSPNLGPLSNGNVNADDVTTLAAEYYLKNVKRNGYVCGTEALGRTEAPADGINHTLTLSINKQIAASFSANVGISASIVSAGVGFSVTETHGVTSSDSVQSGGKATQLVAYGKYELYNFEIWEDDLIWDDYVGTGQALKPYSVCFFAYQR